MLVIGLALAGCAKNKLPNNADGLGLNATPGSQQDFTVNVGDRVFFETDSSALTDQARQTLEKQAAWLQRYTNYPITIEGHADERGTREYNIALGARRAAAAREYLVSRGIPAKRIKTISYGKERPVAVCNDISCWSQNRRAVTVLAAPTG
jgi:peptidoglycan-associated lipoprotein